MTDTSANTIERGWLETRLEDPKFRRAYARETLIEDFLFQLERTMDEKGVSRVQLAEKLGCSPANVTRIMRRTTNLSASTIADLAFVLDCRVRLHVEPLGTLVSTKYLQHIAGASVTEQCAKPQSWDWRGGLKVVAEPKSRLPPRTQQSMAS